METRDLYYGSGSRSREPRPGRYVFVEEDLDGDSPKFVVRDRTGTKWKVKVGREARPETVATRFVWAVGFATDEDYFVPALRVRDMPPKLRRGGEFVAPDGTVRDARWERMDREKLRSWSWHNNDFEHTRELNGLRVMMALLNNYDMKEGQNAVYQRGKEEVYVVSDIGATLGATGSRWPLVSKKGDLEAYGRSGFIRNVTDEYVDFVAPSWPMLGGFFPVLPIPYPWITAPVRLFGGKPAPDVTRQFWIGKKIPRHHVSWISRLLSALSKNQIRDAFRAAHYSDDEIEGFSRAIERRIGELSELRLAAGLESPGK
jgi:hypothetical protein